MPTPGPNSRRVTRTYKARAEFYGDVSRLIDALTNASLRLDRIEGLLDPNGRDFCVTLTVSKIGERAFDDGMLSVVSYLKGGVYMATIYKSLKLADEYDGKRNGPFS